jgi:DNA-binding NtrC family response regulator
MEALKRYPWPGNVRELENLVRRLAALYPQDEISRETIENELNSGGQPALAGDSAAAPSRTICRSGARSNMCCSDISPNMAMICRHPAFTTVFWRR